MRHDSAVRRPPPWGLGALVVAGLVLTAACGASGPASSDTSVDEQLGLDQAGLLQRQARVENLVRDCMKAQGFEYVPVDPAARQTALVGTAGLSEDDFEKQYGYGITTLYERRRQQAAGGPNQAIRDALSAPERAAYDRVLGGEQLDATFADAIDTGDFSRLGGCTRQAADQAFGGAEILQSVQAKLDDLDARIVADPRMVRAIAAWSSCMRSQGFDLTNPDRVDVVLKQKLLAIVGTLGQPYDEAALAELGREEVAMVGADLACEKQHITRVEDAVRTEYERTFREQNAPLLSRVPPP